MHDDLSILEKGEYLCGLVKFEKAQVTFSFPVHTMNRLFPQP